MNESLPPVEGRQRTVLITGCSSGIGQNLALYLRERGWRVFPTARKPEDVEALRRDGFEAQRLDVNDRASMESAVQAVLAAAGALEALVNNAGFGQPGAVETLSRDMLREQFEVNVFGVFELTNLLVPVFRRQGFGRIVNLSSVAGLIASPCAGAYCASKFALEALSDSMRIELRGTGIDVVLVEPGPIATRFHDKLRRIVRERESENFARSREDQAAREERDRRRLPFTESAASSSRVIFRALSARRPRRRYRVTMLAHVIAAMRILPAACMDWILASRLYSQPPQKTAGN